MTTHSLYIVCDEHNVDAADSQLVDHEEDVHGEGGGPRELTKEIRPAA